MIELYDNFRPDLFLLYLPVSKVNVWLEVLSAVKNPSKAEKFSTIIMYYSEMNIIISIPNHTLYTNVLHPPSCSFFGKADILVVFSMALVNSTIINRARGINTATY